MSKSSSHKADNLDFLGRDVGAYDELAAFGELRTLGVELLYDTARAVSFRYPGPSAGGWSSDDVKELAHDVISSNRFAPNIAIYLLAHSVDDNSLKHALQWTVRHHLQDLGRETTKGRLIRRLRELLAEAPFVRVDRDVYAHAGFHGSPPATSASSTDLRAAAWKVPARLVRWKPSATRNAPFGEKESLIAVMTEVLTAAAEPLHVGTIADVVGDRFGVVWNLPNISYDDPNSSIELVADPAATDLVDQEALAILDQLEIDEMRILLVLGEPARDVASSLGIGKTKANELMRRTAAVVAIALGVGDPESVDHAKPIPEAHEFADAVSDKAAVFQRLTELAVARLATPPNSKARPADKNR